MALRRARAARDRYLDTLIVLIPLGVGLAALGGAVIARSALRPVDEMARTARRITAEDLSRRVERRGSGDELDALAETLNEMLARLDAAFGQTRRFAADAAHELRTPLTVLRGGIEVALRDGAVARGVPARARLEPRGGRAPDPARGGPVAALALARPAPRAPAAPSTWSRSCSRSSRWARGCQAAGVSVRVEATAPAPVSGDATALRRALLNLVENAVKYTPAGGKVELGLGRGDGRPR